MKAVSVSQPWATLLVHGLERLETRPWATAHRGPILIHASKHFPPAARALCRTEPFCTLLSRSGYVQWRDLPAGKLVGVAEITGCTRVEELRDLPDLERQIGDFSPGRWAWLLAGPRPLVEPVPYRGRLGLFDVPDDLLRQANLGPAAPNPPTR